MPDKKGEDNTCLYPKAYGFLLGYNSPVVGKLGLRKTLESSLWNEDQCTVMLTTDNDLQAEAYRVLENMQTQDASIVILENSTGKVKTFVSKGPVELNVNEPEKFVEDANRSEDGFIWRGISDLHPPGSTFKLVTAGAALEKGFIGNDLIYYDNGEFQCADNSDVVHNYGNFAYGTLDMSKALMVSSNTYFANLALKVGNADMLQTAERFLFNRPIKLDFCVLESSYTLDGEDFLLAQTGFGQGKTLLSPMHLAMIFQSISNDGEMMAPFVISSISTKSKVLYSSNPEKLSQVFSKETCQRIREVSKDAADSYGLPAFTTFAKSGTAECANEKTMSYLGSADDKYTYLISSEDVKSSLDLYEPMVKIMQSTH